jgi:small-conductance mechanosensitive channel
VRIKVPLVVASTTDVELAEKLMLEAMLECPRVIRTRPSAAWITELGEAGIAFEIRFWINDPEEGLANVRSDVLKLVWKRFKDHGIELPNRAERDVSLRDTPELRALIEALRGRNGAAQG